MVEWFQLVQDKGCWQAHVNAVMNVRFLPPGSRLIIEKWS
jgi:hypothetical protein